MRRSFVLVVAAAMLFAAGCSSASADDADTATVTGAGSFQAQVVLSAPSSGGESVRLEVGFAAPDRWSVRTSEGQESVTIGDASWWRPVGALEWESTDVAFDIAAVQLLIEGVDGLPLSEFDDSEPGSMIDGEATVVHSNRTSDASTTVTVGTETGYVYAAKIERVDASGGGIVGEFSFSSYGDPVDITRPELVRDAS